MRLRTLLTPVLAVGLILSAALVPVSCDNKQAKIVDAELKLSEGIQSSICHNCRFVRGDVVNTGNTKLDWVTVTVKLYDSYGRLLDEDSESTDVDIVPGDRWSFSVLTHENATRFKTSLRYG